MRSALRWANVHFCAAQGPKTDVRAHRLGRRALAWPALGSGPRVPAFMRQGVSALVGMEKRLAASLSPTDWSMGDDLWQALPILVIPFQNPIEDVPAIEATADLELFPAERGGLESPLGLPSPSLVFRDLEAEGIVGYTAVIADDTGPRLEPGTTIQCRVTFVGVPREKVWPGRRFALWAGEDKGSATIMTVMTDTACSPEGE